VLLVGRHAVAIWTSITDVIAINAWATGARQRRTACDTNTHRHHLLVALLFDLRLNFEISKILFKGCEPAPHSPPTSADNDGQQGGLQPIRMIFFHHCVSLSNNLAPTVTNAMHLFETIYKRTGTSRPNELFVTEILTVICSMFFCVFVLRRHVSGVFTARPHCSQCRQLY